MRPVDDKGTLYDNVINGRIDMVVNVCFHSHHRVTMFYLKKIKNLMRESGPLKKKNVSDEKIGGKKSQQSKPHVGQDRRPVFLIICSLNLLHPLI